jgi:hypothetical protein
MHVEINLTIADAGGQWWIDGDADSRGRSDAFNPYDAILRKCDALICMLNPTEALKRVKLPGLLLDTEVAMPGDIELKTMLARLHCVHMANHASVDTRVAICLAQMDRPEHLNHLGREEAYFRRLYGTLPLQNWVGRDRWKFFGCSAAGVRRRAGYVASNTFHDQEGDERILDPAAPPLHIFRPLKWMLRLGQS